jgi:hypothetical protein
LSIALVTYRKALSYPLSITSSVSSRECIIVQWANEIKNVENKKERGRRKEVNLATIAANNHYAGFGPGTANLFRKMVGLSELSWENRNQLQGRLELRKRQLYQLEQDQQIRNSSKVPPKNIKKRQSSMVEFMG